MLVFGMVHLAPGNPARVLLGERATEAAVRALEEELGLNRPLPEQYLRFLGRVVRLDLGRSIRTNRPVVEEIRSYFPATLELTLGAMVFAIVVGMLLGIWAATRRGRLADLVGMTVSLVGVSVPIYCLGLLLILLFSQALGLLPVGGRLDSALTVPVRTGLLTVDALLAGDLKAWGNALKHLVLPALTLGTVPMAIISRMTRSSLLEVLGQDYIRTARAKGLPWRMILFKHALRNALIPVVTVIGLEFGYLLGGAVLTESIFSWPGIGRWIVRSVEARDLPAVQGGVLFVAVIFMTVTLLVDLLYAWIDPRIRVSG